MKIYGYLNELTRKKEYIRLCKSKLFFEFELVRPSGCLDNKDFLYTQIPVKILEQLAKDVLERGKNE